MGVLTIVEAQPQEFPYYEASLLLLFLFKNFIYTLLNYTRTAAFNDTHTAQIPRDKHCIYTSNNCA